MEDHWHRMPKSWAQTFEKFPPENLANLLTAERCDTQRLWPLSLLALQSALSRLCIPREPMPFEYKQVSERAHSIELKLIIFFLFFQNVFDVNNNNLRKQCKTHEKLQTILTKKNIKEKKRHEIDKMSQLTARIANDCNACYIVDFGAGLGHLARALAFDFGAKVCCLEQQSTLIEQAM